MGKEKADQVLEADAVGWPSRCTWSVKKGGQDKTNTIDYPHHHVKTNLHLNRASVIQDSVLDTVGQTPIVRLNNLAKLYGI